METTQQIEFAKPPKDWDKWVSSAYLRMLGQSLNDVAKGVGRSRKTIWTWEQNRTLWERAKLEAQSRWMNDLIDVSRATLIKSIREGNADAALKVLERTQASLAPPRMRQEISGPGGGAVQVSHLPPEEIHSAFAELAKNPDAAAAMAKLADHLAGKKPESPGDGT